MPVDASGYPDPPTDLAALSRRVVALERLAELTGGSRTLTAASIGKGGLRVIKDGDVRIEDTGSLIIQTGNLILGAGKIDGAALKNQLEPDSKTATSSNVALSTSWATKVSLTLAAPAWAKTAVVQAYGILNAKNNDSATDVFNWNGQMRLQVAGDTSLDTTIQSVNTSATGTAFRATGSLSFADTVDVSVSKSVPVLLQARSYEASTFPANTTSRADLYVVVLYFR
jgi:hypothetical protein